LHALKRGLVTTEKKGWVFVEVWRYVIPSLTGKPDMGLLPLQAVTTAMMPTLNMMAVMGLVSIPGVMTGQILAGQDPSDVRVCGLGG